ncbi:MAG: leucine-rich repeat protein, partial [Clostridia bacterium]|nr:leucine-rich repeat protein [Clostridia bacterium]
NAFNNCRNLTKITIPDSVTDMDDTFYGCTSLQCNEYDNAYYLGNSSNPYVILIKAKNQEITSCQINRNTQFIYNNAFNNCRNLTKITIPDSVTSLGSNIFTFGCNGLTSVTIGRNVTYIPTETFSFCLELKTVIINSQTIAGLNSLDNSSLFKNATAVYVKNDIETIGEGITSTFQYKGICDKSGYVKYQKNEPSRYIYYGSYPQTYVGDDMNTTLEAWYDAKSAEAKTADIVQTYHVGNSSNTDGRDWVAYLYTDNNTYVRGLSKVDEAGYTYTGGATVKGNGVVAWFKVEPIMWQVLNWDEVLDGTAETMDLFACNVIASNVQFYPNTTDEHCSEWYNSEIRTWLNDDFYNSAFTTAEKSGIVTKTLENNTSILTEDGTGVVTQDDVYLQSYWNMLDGAGFFTGNGERQKKTTDFALSNNAYQYIFNGSYDHYFLRSTTRVNDICYISWAGWVYTGIGVDWKDMGVVPSISLIYKDSQVVISKTVAANVYKNNTMIESATIENSVESIGDSAFEGCTSLKTVTFDEGCTAVLSANLFKDCTSLTTVTCASGQNEFWDSTFAGCSSLETVTIRNKAIITDFPVDRSSISSNVYLMDGYDESLLDNVYLNITEYNLRASMTTLKALANIAEYLGYGDMDVDVRIYKYSASNPGATSSGVDGWWHYDANNKPVKC